MDWKYIHLIEGYDTNIVYHYPTFNIIAVSPFAMKILKMLKDGMSVSEVLEQHKPYADTIMSFLDSIEKKIKNGDENVVPKYSNRKYVHRITLHVTNDCNLRCKYCFADGGSYGQLRGVMSKQTAKEFVNFCAVVFDKIDKIVFFGGEPLLNVDVMEFICDEFENYYKNGKSLFMPKFVIITNGTLMTPKILQFIKKNISLITVSIDGPKKINDANRVYSNGKGSFKKVANFIRTILNETNVHIQYEATFTKAHLDAHYKHIDIKKALKNEFGINGIVVDESSLENQQRLEEVKNIDYKRLLTNNFLDLPNDFWQVLNAIIYKQTLVICPIIKGIFAVNVNGDIYACHMINGDVNSCFGNIKSDNVFTSPSLFASINSKILLKEGDECRKCWAQKLCGGCAVQRFYNHDKKEFTSIPNIQLCSLTKQSLEQILLLITIVRKDPKLWNSLIEKETHTNPQIK